MLVLVDYKILIFLSKDMPPPPLNPPLRPCSWYAGMHNTLRSKDANFKKRQALIFHQSRGSCDSGIFGSSLYFCNLLSTYTHTYSRLQTLSDSELLQVSIGRGVFLCGGSDSALILLSSQNFVHLSACYNSVQLLKLSSDLIFSTLL